MKIYESDLPDDFKVEGEIAIDTETMGLKPHRDRLCLVQLATRNKDVSIVQFKDMQFNAPNLVRLLNNPKIMKIFHYARFDVATLVHHLKGADIQNIFCTKVASCMARTYTDKHGLKNLVKELLGVELDKTEQSSYWGAVTLSEKQKQYAASDVLYLCQLKDILIDRLKREGRYELTEECFKFLQTQAKIDLFFGEETEIFSYKMHKKQ